ncbi:gamma-glutamylcyclotransferase family protein [Rivihabitans pingtungensis]|jgi:gamma-glutamylcyclotransferase (GGCT)/AIG2-like uncharacterized protein YtfP|uniref:gamma-glutamylcyclotransferase family protein n=1 Tax=Rivihabitans pingtungensis TaxID=1054498 RepID=UPI002899E468|nr:gamma-glutamylcyclotransferase family protein [Rivihabitans pingtungensis]
MKLHPVTLPVFVYGTLKAGGLYHHLIAHQIEGSDEASTRGSLYYKIFNCNQTGRREVTAAYSPDGPFPIAGTLLFPRASEYYSLLSRLDELEFNFDASNAARMRDPSLSTRQYPLRVYLRDVVNCTTTHGVSYLAWCYVYHPIISIPHANLIPADEGGVTRFDPEVGGTMLHSGLIFEDGLVRL